MTFANENSSRPQRSLAVIQYIPSQQTKWFKNGLKWMNFNEAILALYCAETQITSQSVRYIYMSGTVVLEITCKDVSHALINPSTHVVLTHASERLIVSLFFFFFFFKKFGLFYLFRFLESLAKSFSIGP
jgi:hypothetical protein